MAGAFDRSAVHAGWLDALEPVAGELAGLEAFLASEPGYLPAPDAVLRALRVDPQDVRVLIVGQDPYPTPGHAVGLAFSTAPHVRPLPRSLANIYTELRDDLDLPTPEHGDLSAWSDRGVLLLNRVLTVRPGEAGSHRRRGWEAVTEQVIRALAERAPAQPLVAILWGNDAQAIAPLLEGVPVIASAHPSPLSARRGFFGSRPFSRANALLVEQGGEAIDWWLGGTAIAPHPTLEIFR
ncbi:uracil-DNA glycosylase [Microterricola viridarii]|uniref:Uracil-DNA glycosylase n=1 Tax=Microterricola viridarii TaxID=412690 RepID=A0A0Y0NA11_9MICO|nr:uracil-DNA glycosylase [Microterricola viridarii]AMB57906.1 uracil-DNA glycosylase [Microterricola viridarii]